MLENLRRACAEPCPHPDGDELRRLAGEVVEWTIDDFERLSQARVSGAVSPEHLAALREESIPESPSPFGEVMQQFRRNIVPNTCRVHHPRFFAFVPSGPTVVSILGDWLASAANFFAGVWVEGAGPAQVELTVLEWFRTLLGMPVGTSGLLTSGGSDANLTALVAARERLSLEERRHAVLYVSHQRHSSLDRAARIMGLRPEQIRRVPVDADLRLSLAALRTALAEDVKPWCIVATAGTTNTGAIDPLPELVDLCRRRGLWLHVDAAYGWANVLDPQGARELAGIGDVDSVTLDPHKWFAQGYEVGALLVREPRMLERAFVIRPEYLEDVIPAEDEVNFSDRGIALTRRFRALKVWLSLKVLGLGWFRRMVTHTRTLAQYAALALSEAGFVVLSTRMSIVCFVWPGADDEAHRAMLHQALETGEIFFSSTRLQGRVVLRLCFVNWRTCADDVDRAVAILRPKP